MNQGKLNESIDDFELEFIARISQNGSGVIISRAKNVYKLLSIFNMWRRNFNISFNFNPALTNEELTNSHNENCLG